MTVFDRNHHITPQDRWQDICSSVVYWLENKISYESRNMINASYDREDIRSELNIKIYSTLQTIRSNWDLENKKIADLVNYSARCLCNHVQNMKKRFAEKIDYSVNLARVDDLTDREDTDAFIIVPSISSEENNILGEDNIGRCALWLLTHGLLEEYLVLKGLLCGEYNDKDKSPFSRVCSKLGITDKKTVKINLLVRLVQFGILEKYMLPHGINLLSYGII